MLYLAFTCGTAASEARLPPEARDAPPPPLVPTRCKLLPYSHVSWKVNSFLPA